MEHGDFGRPMEILECYTLWMIWDTEWAPGAQFA